MAASSTDERLTTTAQPPPLQTHLTVNHQYPSQPTHASSYSDSSVPPANMADPMDTQQRPARSSAQLERPSIGSRKSSGTIIIPRDSPTVEVKDEHYEDGDARAMSPRRSSDEIERMSDEAREALEEQARALQANLLEIVDRVETVKTEHEKLEGGNKFLQSYIGELMQTSKIAPSAATKSKQRGRSTKAK